jgi:hypothetical protein
MQEHEEKENANDKPTVSGLGLHITSPVDLVSSLSSSTGGLGCKPLMGGLPFIN